MKYFINLPCGPDCGGGGWGGVGGWGGWGAWDTERVERTVIALDIFPTGVTYVNRRKWFTETGQIIIVTSQIHGHLTTTRAVLANTHLLSPPKTRTHAHRHRHTDTDTQTQTHRHRHRHTDTDTQTQYMAILQLRELY